MKYGLIYGFNRINSPYFTATYEKGLCGYKAPSQMGYSLMLAMRALALVAMTLLMSACSSS